MLHTPLCPHCQQPYQPKDIWDFSSWKITTQFGSIVLKSKQQVNIFDLLWRKQGMRGLTRERLIDIIYTNDINGGPTAWAISQMVSKLRKDLITVGIYLQRGNKSNEGYSLIFMTPEQAKSKL